MRFAFVAAGLAAVNALAAAPAAAERLGEHPAIIVKRLHANAGYDYATQFYPHPALRQPRLDAADPAVASRAERRPPARSAERLISAQQAAHIDSDSAR